MGKQKVIWALCLISSFSYADTVSEEDMEIVGFAIENVEAIQKLTEMPSSCSSCSIPKPSESSSTPDAADLQVYRCIADAEPSLAPSPTPDPNQRDKKFQIVFYLLNDNLMMGLIPSGDDLGLTHEMALQALKEFKNGGKLKMEVSSSIYTKNARFDLGSEYARAQQMLANGEATYINVVRSNGDKIPVHFLDETKVKATYEKGKTNSSGLEIYYTATLGAIARQTSEKPGKLPPAAAIQNWWHNTLGIYEFEYVPAEGVDSRIERNGTQVTVVSGFEGDQNLNAISRISVLTGGSFGLRKTVYTCELELEAGALVATDGKKLLGPNSYLFARTQITKDFLKKKNGGKALTASAGTAVFYFPSPRETTVKKVGTEMNFSLQGNLGKNNTIHPYMTLYTVNGRQINHLANDLDPRQTIGIKFDILSRKKKKSPATR